MTLLCSPLFKPALAAGVVIGVGIQFIRPPLTNPPVVENLQAPPAVEEILRNSCYNCHSNETRLSWFDQIAPAYWLVASHVAEGRRHLNFSELGGKPIAEQHAVLFESVSQIILGAMPLKSYALAHPDSKVTPEQLATLKAYLDSLEPRPGPEAQGTAANTPGANVQPAPNGIEIPADYKNWRAISSTNRMDNGSLREILGNDVAVKAIQAGNINPWPDGTMFAKVAWDQSADADGTIRAGKFHQVEFMIKDSQKYAATKSWGWARWLGTELRPFGTSPAFTESCVSCHKPLENSDFVFTLPLKGQP